MMDEQMRIRRNLWMFPLGTVGRDMIYALFTNYILTFIMFTRSPTAAQLSAITAIMVVARVFDALKDPLMGNVIERTRTRYGKFKPWLAIGVVLTSLIVYFAFNTNLYGWDFVVFFGVIYFLYSIAYTMHDISYWGMVASLSSDADARNMLTSRATLFACIGGTLASMLIPMLTTGEMAIGGNASTAYGYVALIICILSPLFLCFTIFGVQERRDVPQEKAPPVSFRKILSTISGNDQLKWITAIFLIHQVGGSLVVAGVGSTYIYFEFGYQGGLYSLFSTIGMLGTAFLMLFYPAISRKIHRKRLMSIMMVSTLAGSVIMLSAMLLDSAMAKFWLVTIGYMVSNFGQYSFNLIMVISLINTVEYNEYKHGRRDEAIITSLRPFLTKLCSALVVALTSLCYFTFGVTDYTNRISALESDAAAGLITEAEKLASIGEVIAAVQPVQTDALFLCITLLPCLTMLIAYLLYRRFYRLDEEEYDRICQELEQRHKAA